MFISSLLSWEIINRLEDVTFPRYWIGKKSKSGKNDFLIFGSETAGISEKILYAHPDNMCTIPMKNENIRSLNLATSVGIVLYEALRQING